jgi:biopolymer transport protein ExbB
VPWWDNSWTQRQQLTFNNNFAGSASLTDFPVLIALNSGNIDYAQTAAGGADLRFLSANVSPLSYEIESWNPAGNSYVWVKIPQINANSSTDSIWMYYGNAAAPAGQNTAAVWTGKRL